MRKLTPNRIGPRLDQVRAFMNELPRDMHEEFVNNTPIRTGNAKRSTDFKSNEIQGNYNYANRLNKGWSRQAPNGMTDPTIEYARQRVRAFR